MPRARSCFVASLLIFALLQARSVEARSNACDPQFVGEAGNLISVVPTGIDDTANLQCAIDLAGTLGAGATVQLAGGVFQTHQLVIQSFSGTIRGVGREITTIQNASTPMHVTNPVTWPDAMPSSANPYPTLISVIGDDVSITDLGIHIVGLNPTDAWYWGGGGPFHFVVPALAVVGSHMVFRAKRIEIDGSGKCFPDPGANLLADFEFWNFGSRVTPRISGTTVVIEDSVFRNCGALFADELDQSRFIVTRNELQSSNYGVNFSGLSNSSVEVSHNTFPRPSAGLSVWQGNLGTGIRDSTFLIRNNQFAGSIGIRLHSQPFAGPATQLFYGEVGCAMLGNDMHATTVGYLLGGGTYGCTILGQGNTTVIDETNGLHVIVGATPVPGGVGSDIAPLLGGR